MLGAQQLWGLWPWSFLGCGPLPPPGLGALATGVSGRVLVFGGSTWVLAWAWGQVCLGCCVKPRGPGGRRNRHLPSRDVEGQLPR